MSTIIEKFAEFLLNRMRPEHKEHLLEIAVEKFLENLTPDEKERLIEKVVRRLLADVEIKRVFPQIMAMVWKEAGEADWVARMTKAAAHTSGKISDFVAGRKKDPSTMEGKDG